ncbi:MAG: nitroreductase family deazaflavin-dependent oxidoreductase [Sphingomonadales bacterium]|nr:nitroreductase family deazaflavin-dependent oxidoreductase [Sphingomonadales bacterium]
MAFEGTDALLARTQDFVTDHRALYLGSGGARGHIVDFRHAGARGLLPSLLLRTIGRRSGAVRTVPLIYGLWGDEWVVVGSKGGAPDHPAWFLNLSAQETCEFQVATQAFRGTWRVAAGSEHATVWAYMSHVYPPYAEYLKAAQGRAIPLVLLKALAPIAPFPAEG